MLEFYLRHNDPLSPVYEINPDAGTWRMAASAIGVISGVGGEMPDGGARFRDTELYTRVYPTGSQDGRITFSPHQADGGAA